MTKTQSRAARWVDAASAAEQALQTLVDLQQEFQEWRDNLPENLAAWPVGERLDAVVDLDLQGALDTVSEASGLDLPQGFGRD